jgi:hypothetical protein
MAMRKKMFFQFLLIFVFQSLVSMSAQVSVSSPVRFKPYAGLTYNYHTMENLVRRAGEVDYFSSHFPGIEFGFTLAPDDENGWSLEYMNTFLGELAIYGIADQTRNPYNGFLNDIVDRTVGNGFLGRLDIGKTLMATPGKRLLVGFVIADKVVLGSDDLVHVREPETTISTKDGFHFTPGLFAALMGNLPNLSTLTVNISLSQSLFNLHQFGEENIQDHFLLPLFTELQFKYQIPAGIYFRAAALMAMPYKELPADARISAGIGYTFRHNEKSSL